MSVIKGRMFGIVSGFLVAMAILFFYGEYELKQANERLAAADIQEEEDVFEGMYGYGSQDTYFQAHFKNDTDKQPKYKSDILEITEKLDNEPESAEKTEYIKTVAAAVEDSNITDSEYAKLKADFEKLENNSMSYIARKKAKALIE